MHSASDVILRRENLLSLAKQVELVKNWDISRPRALKLKDQPDRVFRGHPSEEAMLNTMVAYLETEV